MTSVGPPAVNPTMTRTGRVGYAPEVCAYPAVDASTAVAIAIACTTAAIKLPPLQVRHFIRQYSTRATGRPDPMLNCRSLIVIGGTSLLYAALTKRFA